MSAKTIRELCREVLAARVIERERAQSERADRAYPLCVDALKKLVGEDVFHIEFCERVDDVIPGGLLYQEPGELPLYFYYDDGRFTGAPNDQIGLTIVNKCTKCGKGISLLIIGSLSTLIESLSYLGEGKQQTHLSCGGGDVGI